MYTKEQYLNFKKIIKGMVAEQKENRRNRKSINLVGDRTIHAGTAQMRHISLRYSLHHYYIAYAVIKGKSVEWINQHVDKSFTPENKIVQAIIAKHGEAICVGAE